MVAVDLALMTLKMRADAVAVLPPEMIVRKREMSTSLSNLETTGATVSHPKYICVKMLTVLVGTEEWGIHSEEYRAESSQYRYDDQSHKQQDNYDDRHDRLKGVDYSR